MPKLTIFTPCEKVIIGQGNNAASIIDIIQGLQFKTLIPSQQIDEKTGVFARFSIFAQWHRLPSDEGKTFEQKITLARPGEKPVLEALTEFQMTEQLHRVTAVSDLLPYLPIGEYQLCLFLRQKGTQDWPATPIADYPIDVTHTPSVMVHT